VNNVTIRKLSPMLFLSRYTLDPLHLTLATTLPISLLVAQRRLQGKAHALDGGGVALLQEVRQAHFLGPRCILIYCLKTHFIIPKEKIVCTSKQLYSCRKVRQRVSVGYWTWLAS
jgi:hypothetical protein